MKVGYGTLSRSRFHSMPNSGFSRLAKGLGAVVASPTRSAMRCATTALAGRAGRSRVASGTKAGRK